VLSLISFFGASRPSRRGHREYFSSITVRAPMIMFNKLLPLLLVGSCAAAAADDKVKLQFFGEAL
jgi:hypothetical protein